MRSAVLVALALSGCAPLSVESDMQHLREQLAESEAARANLSRRVEDLELRVAALAEKSERPVATSGASPRAIPPVVTLRPPPAPEQPPLADDENDAPRPSLTTIKMDGDPPPPVAAPPPSTEPHAAVAPRPSPVAHAPSTPTVPPTGENLGVVPLPDRSVPLEHDGGAHAPSPVAALPVERRARETRPPRPSARRTHDDASARAAFQAAEAKLHGGAVDEGLTDLRAFVHTHPDNDLADDAVFEIGEAHSRAREWSAAADAYGEVADRWPSGNRAPESLLKLGNCLVSLGRTDEARATLERLVAAYPSSDAASAARHRLAQIGRTPHAAAEIR